MGKTLSAVNAALNDPAGAFRDDVLATVWILANYEVRFVLWGYTLSFLDMLLTRMIAAGWLCEPRGVVESVASSHAGPE